MNTEELFDIVWQELSNVKGFDSFEYLNDFYIWYEEFIQESNLSNQFEEEELEDAKILIKEELIEKFDLEDKTYEHYREDFTGPSSIY